QSRQTRLPIGIRETANVEYEIRIARGTVAKRKRLKQDRHASFGARTNALTDELAQLVNAAARRIDDEICRVGDRLHQLAFFLNCIGERETRSAERMPATRLAVALEKRVFLRAQEQDVAMKPLRLSSSTSFGTEAISPGLLRASTPTAANS